MYRRDKRGDGRDLAARTGWNADRNSALKARRRDNELPTVQGLPPSEQRKKILFRLAIVDYAVDVYPRRDPSSTN
jgi:hypothetical protein